MSRVLRKNDSRKLDCLQRKSFLSVVLQISLTHCWAPLPLQDFCYGDKLILSLDSFAESQ